ncbi:MULTISPECIES: hypothetical protein [Shewanella]|uniref:hypothetical protein n=1 Tax=Shewanella TaxID=22 RepID=UPI000D345E69|nr:MULTISPECIES: hypothetical protein [Shewanella]MCI2964244.1 hypothetical protein [Shewanella sp. N2AIL]SUI44258.1 Uncharacterised protein [Shewanella baltica]
MMVTIIHKAPADTEVETSEGKITINDGENPLDIRQWMALKIQPGILRRIKNGYISIKDTSVEEEAIKEFKRSFFEQLKAEGYSLVKKKLECSSYKDYEKLFVEQWLSSMEDAAIGRKEQREIDNFRINNSSKKITLFIAVITFIGVIISAITMRS